MILLAAGSLFAACNNIPVEQPQQPYTDLKNDCYKGKVMQVTKTEYEGAKLIDGKWTAPKDAVATVRIYDYDSAGFNTQIKEYYLYNDTMYAVSTQMITFQDDKTLIKSTFSTAGKLAKKMKQTYLADTGISVDVYDSTDKVMQRQIMTLNKSGRQKRTEFSYFEEGGANTHKLEFDFVYTKDDLLDSLKLKMYDHMGAYMPDRDILLVPKDIELDSAGNPTLSIIQGYKAAAGTNLLIQRKYTYYK